MQEVLEGRASHDRVRGAMTGLEEVDSLLARLDDDLRDQTGVFLLQENRLDAIGLRADAVDQAHVRVVGKSLIL
jgi:hypothetical protein